MSLGTDLPVRGGTVAGPFWQRAPWIVVLIGLLLSGLLYWSLNRNEQNHRNQVLAVQSSAVARTLRAGLDQHARVLVRTARRWELNQGRTRADFDLEAAVNVESYPSFRALGWVDPELRVRWVYPDKGNEAVVGFANSREPQRRAALLSARERGQPVVLGPVNLIQGGRSLLFFQPIKPLAGRQQGFIYAAVDTQTFVERVIGDVAAGYSLVISANGETVYQRPGAASQRRGAVSIASVHHGGILLQAKVAAPPSRLGLAELASVASALLSLGLAAMVWLALRAQAKQSLLRSEVRTGQERFRAVFDNAAIGMARVGFEGARFLEVNPALCAILGYSSEELLVTPWTKITHPEDLDLDLVPFTRMAAGELNTYVVDKRFLHRDGHHLWTRLTLSLVRAPDGTPDFEICIVEDISAQKAAEAEVRQARDLLQSIIDGALDPVFVKNQEGRFVFANGRLAELFGQPLNALIGRTDHEFWPPEFAKRVQEVDRSVMQSGSPRIVEEELLVEDEALVLQSQIVPWRDPSGNVIGVIGVGRDITALKNQGRALAASEQRLRVAAQAAGFGSYDWDMIADRHLWSEETYRIFGLPSTSEVTSELVWTRIHPEDLRTIEHDLAEAFRRGADLANEYRIVWPDGSVRTIVNRARVIYEETEDTKRPTRLIGAVRDETEQRQAAAAIREGEARYRTLIESIEAGFSLVELIFDEAGRPIDYRFIEVNPAFERQTGLRGVVGRRVRAVIPELEEHWVETYGRVALTGKSKRFENGSEPLKRWFDVYAVPVGDQAPYRVGILFNDISERRRAEEEVRRLNRDLEAMVAERTRRLEETVAELDAFAYTVSHDLRAPLRGIEGFARILHEEHAEALGTRGQRYARRIYAAAERMDQLIQDLLTYSRLSRADLELKCIGLDAVVNSTLESHRALIEETGAEVLIHRPMPSVHGNRVLIAQVVANLLTNAIKFVPEGSTPRVEIAASGTGGRVRLSVEDNGIGIEPEFRDRIFNVFERLHGQEHYTGTGIGLAIVRKGAERLGGTAGVEPSSEGSRFWVDLPAAEQEEDS